MKIYYCLVIFMISSIVVLGQSKTTNFPKDWEGIWKGTLTTHQVKGETTNLAMELHILPLDSNKWQWKIVYMPQGKTKDERTYELLLKDKTQQHFIIDEKNGIFLDAYFVGGSFISNFAIQETEVMYVLQSKEKKLVLEMITTSNNPLHSTGGTNEKIPVVHSYSIQGYSKAILKRK